MHNFSFLEEKLLKFFYYSEHVILVYFETSHGIYESTNNSDIFYLDGSTKQWPATWAAPQWNAPGNVKWWNAAPNDAKWWNVK